MISPPRKTVLPLAARIGMLATCAGLTIGAAPAKKPSVGASAANSNWAGQIAVTGNGSHTFGNPEAPARLNEFISYTCSHCADFHKEADPILRLSMVPKGQVSVTVTNFMRNPIDLTVAMLTNCGDPKRFFVRHNAFLATQDTWLGKAQKAGREQQARWYQGALTDRMRAIASDLGFYAKMESWSMGRAKVDACFADKTMLDKLRAQQSEAERLGFQGTPSFTLNGQPLEGHDWLTVSRAISAKLAEQRAGNI